MKKLGFILAAAFCLAVVGSSVSAQTTYTWNQTGSAAWTTSTNWTPTRTTPAVDDFLVFNNGATTTVTDVPTQTIGQLDVIGGTTVNLQPAAGVLTLTIGGDSGVDLFVESGSALNISGGTTNTNTLKILVATGATGSISGTMTFSTAQHQLDAADASGITFNSGSTFTHNPGGISGNPFGTTGTTNTVVFASGSTYNFQTGDDPFGHAQPNSKVVFQADSLFRQTGIGNPSFSGRTYANFELNNAAATVTAIGGAAVSINNLTITAGTLNFGMTGTGSSIKGNISVTGTLNFNPSPAGTLNLNGTSAQTISGSGTITLNDADQTVNINNSNGITLSRDLTFTLGALTFTLGNVTTGVNTLIIGSAATVNRTSGHVIGNLRKAFAGVANKTFEVGTANGFSPVAVNATAGTFPADFTAKAVQGPLPAFTAPQFALQRYWPVIAPAGMTLDLTLNYLAIDVPGTANEADFVIYACDGGCDKLGGTVNTVNHSVTVTNQTTDVGGPADLTVAHNSAPTAADGRISGITVDGNGAPISGAVIYLNGTQNRKTITDANGNYRFDNVETSGFYTVTPARVNYSFSPGNRSFSQLGNNTDAAFTGSSSGNNLNPLDTPEYFVRQHYLDFLGREPDESGFNFWSDQMLECGGDAECLERRRINVSAAYFLSIEFQQTGGLVDGLYRASYSRRPLYAEFMPDTATVAHDVIVGNTGWEQQLATNKQQFLDAWVQRAAFRAAYDNLANDGYVDTLISHTGVNFTDGEREALLGGLANGTLSRAQVLQRVAQNERFVKAKFTEAFVRMQYFGYLRRDPDDSGFHFWLNKLNEFDGNFERAEMVKAFLVSGEYRGRFRL